MVACSLPRFFFFVAKLWLGIQYGRVVRQIVPSNGANYASVAPSYLDVRAKNRIPLMPRTPTKLYPATQMAEVYITILVHSDKY